MTIVNDPQDVTEKRNKNPGINSLIASCNVFANPKMRLQESRKNVPKALKVFQDSTTLNEN